MKITGNQVNPVAQVYLSKTKSVRAVEGTDAAKPADKIELSTDAEAIETARKVIAEMPDVRADKVEALRKQIQDGTYQVSPESIADKMLTEMRLSKLSEK